MTEYKTILEIYELCQKLGIGCTLSKAFDGYQIRFLDKADIIQHFGSYGSKNGYVEPAGFGDEVDYSPVTKNDMVKAIVLRYL